MHKPGRKHVTQKRPEIRRGASRLIWAPGVSRLCAQVCQKMNFSPTHFLTLGPTENSLGVRCASRCVLVGQNGGPARRGRSDTYQPRSSGRYKSKQALLNSLGVRCASRRLVKQRKNKQCAPNFARLFCRPFFLHFILILVPLGSQLFQ